MGKTKAREIKVKFTDEINHDNFEISGWLSGETTYLWFGIDGKCVGTFSGKKLHRLAKRIVKEFEKAEAKRR